MILCADPRAQYLPYADEITAAVQKVLDSGRYILGDEVEAFEQEFAEYLGAGFAIGCGNGTDALVLAMKALDIGPGDEVIVPAHTAVPTVAAVVMAGATPVYVDIEADYYTMCPDQVEAACNARTKAIIAVHIYGQAASLDQLTEIAARHNLRLIEDCAQATGGAWHGQKLGTIGDIGCFSFFPTKNLGAIGDGGALVCNDQSVAQRLLALRQYGWDQNRVSQEPGINSRLDEIQAAILRVKLNHLESDNKQRRMLATRYTDALKNLPLGIPLEREEALHVYHLYVVLVDKRDSLMTRFEAAGIHAGIHYPIPVHRMSAYRKEITLPITDRAAASVLSLPLYPGIEEQSQAEVISALASHYSA